MSRIKMKRVSQRVLRTCQVIAAPPDEPLVRGNGETDYVCAGCERVIAESIMLGGIHDLVFECSSCGTSNEAPSPLAT